MTHSPQSSAPERMKLKSNGHPAPHGALKTILGWMVRNTGECMEGLAISLDMN